MSEYEYYTNSPYTNYCKLAGYDDKLKGEMRFERRLFYRLHQSLVQKPLTENEFLGLSFDDEKVKGRDVPTMSREIWQNIKKAHKMK